MGSRLTALRFARTLALVAVALAAVAPALLSAEESAEEIMRQMEEVRRHIPRTPTVAPTRPPISTAITASEAVDEFGQEAPWFRQLRQSQLAGTPPPLLGHIKGHDGIPFPSPEAVVLEPTPTPLAQTPTVTPTATPTPTPYQRPGACERNETLREVHQPKGSDAKLLYDLLFVARDLAPLDVSEAFGQFTKVVPYDVPPSKGQLMRMEIYRVPCLPYRVRMTAKARYVDTGTNALKNYDKDQAGRGEFSKLMRQRLFGKR